MNRPKLKLVGAIALLAALAFLYAMFLMATNTFVNGSYNLSSQAAKIRAINSSVGGIMDLNFFVEDSELDKLTKRVALASVAAKGMINNDWDGKSQAYNNGYIVTVSDNKVKFPSEYPREQRFAASSLTDAYGIVPTGAGKDAEGDAADEAWIVAYARLADGVYYLEYERVSDLLERARLSFDSTSWVHGIEDAFNIKVLLISHRANKNGDYDLLYKSDTLPEGFSTAKDCGITKEILEAVPGSDSLVTAESLYDNSKLVMLEDKPYSAYIQAVKGSEVTDDEVYLAYLIPESELVSMTVEQTVVISVAFLIVGILLLVWFFSLIRLVRHYSLNEEQIEQLETKKTAGKAFSLIIMGCIGIFVVSALLLSLLRLFGICNSVKKSLTVLEQRVEECKMQEKTTADELKNTYVSYAERIAGILKERPELMTKENLQTCSDLIDADYIMIYDSDGREVISNSRYINMELGTSPESSTYEFRRLLKGIPSVVHDARTDEETGLKNALIGVPMEYYEDMEEYGEYGEYGALLVAVSEDRLKPKKTETLNDVMTSLVAAGTVAFSVDPESQTIVNSSDSRIAGRNAVSLNMPETALVDSYRDFFTIGNKNCYGESKDIDGYLYYYAAEQPHIFRNILPYAGIAAIVSFALLSVIIGYMMFGYRKGFEYWSKQGIELVETADDDTDIDDDSDQQTDPRNRWKLSLSSYGLHTPVHNAAVTLEIMMVLVIIGIGIWYYIYGESSSGSLLSYVIHGSWTKGLNLFSFTSILILFAQVVITVMILKALIRVVLAPMGAKGETFCRLALNLLTYAGGIFFVYMALYNMGINLGALVASLSLPAFALSLGAKDLITDIVAGISIVFDQEFKVGDIVDIGGYRGTVLEIGVRTTKLLGSGKNIKIISNRDIKNVINMSRRSSYCGLDIKISMSAYKLKDVEDILNKELPKLKEQLPGIISGPSYAGVKEIGGDAAVLSITAECDEASTNRVRRALNHALQDILDENGITLK